ncbi:MAG: hypothetical protein IJU84_07980 [Clostridia bacterium]|nr:hypothetical protein [Clostridia bacterium]
MKKIMAMCLAATLFAGSAVLSACRASVKEPVYESTRKYEIGMWVGVPEFYYDAGGNRGETLTDEEFLQQYRYVADAGITIAFPGYYNMGDGRTSYNMKALKAAHEVGIKQIIADSQIRNLLFGAKAALEICADDAERARKEAEIVESTKAYLKYYTDSEYADALYGFMIKDEPGTNMFEQLGIAGRIFKKAAPDLMFYCNLFPVIAGGAQLSGGSGSVNYNTYLNKWAQTVDTDYISYDHYPLYSDGINYTMEKSFLYNMDVMQTLVRDEGKGRRVWTFLQSIQFGAKNRALASTADASFQAYSYFAYGGDGIQWFCYCCPPGNDGATNFANNALMNRELQKTDTYTYVRNANNYIHALMPYYENFEWQGVVLSDVSDAAGNFSYLEASENLITSTETLKKLDSTEDAFAGVFKDKDGREGYMVVNFTDPALNISNTVNMTFGKASNAVVVKNGVKETVKVKGNKLSLELKPGDGAFVIPY